MVTDKLHLRKQPISVIIYNNFILCLWTQVGHGLKRFGHKTLNKPNTVILKTYNSEFYICKPPRPWPTKCFQDILLAVVRTSSIETSCVLQPHFVWCTLGICIFIRYLICLLFLAPSPPTCAIRWWVHRNGFNSSRRTLRWTIKGDKWRTFWWLCTSSIYWRNSKGKIFDDGLTFFCKFSKGPFMCELYDFAIIIYWKLLIKKIYKQVRYIICYVSRCIW